MTKEQIFMVCTLPVTVTDILVKTLIEVARIALFREAVLIWECNFCIGRTSA